MNLGKIVGTVVSSTVNTGIPGGKYILVERCDQHGELKGDFLVALDPVGAGYKEMVMISEGSPARETLATTGKAVDAMVVGIIDLIDENDKIVYKK
ncbi:MAG: EutN/CcmL family microcompartment protein [Bacteroidetes bacterium]|nr:EutN/CcmL family microcompartment protein [Bacteroidota bacterium]